MYSLKSYCSTTELSIFRSINRIVHISFHSDSAALSATYRMNTLPLAHDTFLYSFNTAIPFRIRATATLDASIVNTDKESRTYQIYTTFLPFSPGCQL